VVDAIPDDPGIEDATSADTTLDVEAGPDGDPTVIIDGSVCTGHDEDLDGIPDRCDDCPGFSNKEQKLGALEIGNACASLASGDLPFDRASHRLFFDPFLDFDRRWTRFGGGEAAFDIDSSGDRMGGGTALDSDFRFLLTNTELHGVVVVSTVVERSYGIGGDQSSGILLRATGSPKQFLYCYRGQRGPDFVFGVATSPPPGCSGGTCTPVFFPTSFKVAPSEIDVSSEDALIGLRASVSGGDGATQASIECRIFDPNVKHSVHNADPRYVVRVDLTDPLWLSSGSVGLAAQLTNSRFHWMEVLVDPKAISPF
jgi:hypothetical protein